MAYTAEVSVVIALVNPIAIVFIITGCPPGGILCLGTEDDPECISELNVCDGSIQCPAGDDELNGSCSKLYIVYFV